MRVEWRYTTMVNGVQYVMMDGTVLMLVLCVDNWDLDHLEYLIEELILVKDQDQSGSIILYVEAMNQH